MDACETKYKTREGYIHRKVAGNDVLISVGENVANFNGYITLNPAASFLWDALAEPRTVSMLTQLLTEEFEVSEETARQDAEQFIAMLLQHNMVEAYGNT